MAASTSRRRPNPSATVVPTTRRGDGLGGEQVEGRHAVRELLVARRRQVREVLIADGVRGDILGDISDAAAGRAVVRTVPRARIETLARSDAPQGVIAFADAVPARELGELLDTGQHRPFLIVLDGVTDPHNLGALLRTAACAGVTGAVIARHRSARLSPAAVKAAAGAVEHVPIAVVGGIPAALSRMATAGVWSVGLDPGGRSVLWDLPVASEAVAVVLGAEGRGLSPLVRRRCEVLARIPMPGRLGALNVAAAGALACFEVARRRPAGAAGAGRGRAPAPSTPR